MRWSIIRLIWHRELRDLARDRRWLFMLLGLPILLYPAFGLFGFVFASMMFEKPFHVGIHGLEYLPRSPAGSLVGPAAEVGWLAAVPAPGGSAVGPVAGAAAGMPGSTAAGCHPFSIRSSPSGIPTRASGRWSARPTSCATPWSASSPSCWSCGR